VNRRSTQHAARTLRTSSDLRTSVERLESRAMLAGLGPESWSAAGPTTAPLSTGALVSAGAILTCSSPLPGSTTFSSLPVSSSSSGSLASGGLLWLSSTSGSGAGPTVSGSGGGITSGPVLSSQASGGTGVGSSAGSITASRGTVNGVELLVTSGAASGTGDSQAGSAGSNNTNGPAVSSQASGGTGGGLTTSAAISGSGGLQPVFYDSAQIGLSTNGLHPGATGSTTLTLAATLTPLAYQPGSNDGPGFVLGVWTGDEGGVQFFQVAEPESPLADTAPLGRPTWDEVKDWFQGPRWQFEFEADLGLWDPPGEESRPKDDFDLVPTDENGNYSWKSYSEFVDFIARTKQLGKDFATHMAEWFGPDEVARAAKPVIAGGRGLTVIAFGASEADNLDDLARAARNGKLPRWDGKKPDYAVNPAHAPETLRPGKTPIPEDAEEVFRHAVPDSDSNARHWYGQNAEGKIYRFSNSNDGSVHFSGIDGVGDGIRNMTEYARKRLEEMFR
jgi:hypothetical protein